MSSQIPHYLHKPEQMNFLNNEMKLCPLLLHKETLLEYPQHKKIRKGLQLKFQWALCCDDNNLRKQCNSILRSASLKIQRGIIKAPKRNIFKLQKHKNILHNKMVDLLSDKQYKKIMRKIKKKVNILFNKLQKTKQKKHSRDKVTNDQETGKKNCRYLQEKRKAKIR